MGVADCDNMLMLLGVSEQLTRRQRDVVVPLVIQGFSGKQELSIRWGWRNGVSMNGGMGYRCGSAMQEMRL